MKKKGLDLVGAVKIKNNNATVKMTNAIVKVSTIQKAVWNCLVVMAN